MQKTKQRKPRSDKGKKRIYRSRIDGGFKEIIQKSNSHRLPPPSISQTQYKEIVSSLCIFCGSSSDEIILREPREGYHEDNCAGACSKCAWMVERGGWSGNWDGFLRHVNKIVKNNKS